MIMSVQFTAVLLTTQIRAIEPRPDEKRHSVVGDIKEGLGYILQTQIVFTLLATRSAGVLLLIGISHAL